MALFGGAGRAIGGFFDRLNAASQTPAFGLGIGFLQGDPQQGLQNAVSLAQAQRARSDEERAFAFRQQQAQQEATQQAIENQFKERSLGLQEQALAPNLAREAAFAYPDDPAAQRRYVAAQSAATRDAAQRQFQEQQNDLNRKNALAIAQAKIEAADAKGGLTENQVVQVAKSFGTDFEQAAKGSLAVAKDVKIRNVIGHTAADIVDNPTLTGQLRYALARLANGGGVLSVQDVTMADGSSLYDNIVGQANQLAGKGKMSLRQAQRGIDLLKAGYDAETQYLNDLAMTQIEQAKIAGVPERYFGLVTPAYNAPLPAAAGQAATPDAGGWTDEKERRYQELLKKLGSQ